MRRVTSFLGVCLIGLLVLSVWWFVEHAVGRGLRLADPDEIAASRLYRAEAPLSTLAIYGHMVVGGLLTLLAPLQLLGPVRRRLPRLHHVLGYTVAGLALTTGIGGLVYIAAHGTIGGAWMSAGFGLYGLLLIGAATQTVLLARRRHPAHRAWAARLVILALGSWIYRMHYGLWHAFTGGAGMQDDFGGIFDRIQVFAFYLPYLMVLELALRLPALLRLRGRAARATT
ncbi:DUF2306 domain-containing protein [Cereibacter sphaeroides]|uniref:DUF2306 domain-containing protein n=1 Tax=Cereibacter sphaeroides TaxID=1063 RepID=UPI001F207E29|nr:DUF2306 domain-containing protein [Cereibacter sphaeroides]MCE6969995.1 DUF2306 domain-containing protein [Cereibacter sphaeroides]